MKNKDGIIKKYKKYFTTNKGKKFILSVTTIALLVTPFAIQSISTSTMEDKAKIEEMEIKKNDYTADEIIEMANDFYSTSNNEYSEKLIKNSLETDLTSRYEIVDSKEYDGVKKFYVRGIETGVSVFMHAAEDNIGLLYSFPSKKRYYKTESFSYLYTNNREEYQDLISVQYSSEDGIIKITNSISGIKDKNEERMVFCYIECKDGKIDIFYDAKGFAFLEYEGKEYMLTHEVGIIMYDNFNNLIGNASIKDCYNKTVDMINEHILPKPIKQLTLSKEK